MVPAVDMEVAAVLTQPVMVAAAALLPVTGRAAELLKSVPYAD